jgi:drug/metabolite transporter (DMT)-like permease
MKRLTPQQWAGILLFGQAAIVLGSWGLFLLLTSAVHQSPLARLLQQLAAVDGSAHPIVSIGAGILAAASFLLGSAFLSPLASRKNGAMSLVFLAVLVALGSLVALGVAPFVYVAIICVLAYRGYQNAAAHS